MWLYTLLMAALVASISRASVIQITPSLSSLVWLPSSNQTLSSVSAMPGSVYNILTMPVSVNPALATVTIINTLNLSLSIQWKNTDVGLPRNSTTDVAMIHIITDDIIPFNLTYANGSLILPGSISGVTVDGRVVIKITESSQSISYKATAYRPCYQLQYRDRDQAKLFMTEAVAVGNQDWILENGFQVGFNLNFSFTIPIQSFNFYVFTLVRFDGYNGRTSSFYPLSGSAPLLHLIPYWYSITPRWNNQLQAGDQLTVAGSFAIGSQSMYICFFKVSGRGGQSTLSSDAVMTNNTGMFQCVVPELPPAFKDRVQNGDVLRVVPGFLESWRAVPAMYAMMQVETQDNKFTLVVPDTVTPWWSFTSWSIYVIIALSMTITVIVVFFCLTRYLRHRRRAALILEAKEVLADEYEHDYADPVSMIEAHSNIMRAAPIPTSSPINIQHNFGMPSEPIDVQSQPKVLVKPSRFDWVNQRRNSQKELLLQRNTPV